MNAASSRARCGVNSCRVRPFWAARSPIRAAGIPLTSGFTGKWAVFESAVAGGAWPLVVIAVLLSAVAAFFYVRVIVLMFFSEPVGEGPAVTMPSVLTTITIAGRSSGSVIRRKRCQAVARSSRAAS